MRLAFDIDGVFADFSTAYANLLIEVDGKDRLPEGWRNNPELHTPVWYWERHYGYSKEVEKNVWENHILKSKDFWYELEALPGAGETIHHINKLVQRGHDVYFLTHRMGLKAKRQTEDWLNFIYDDAGNLRGMDNPTVLLSSDKTPILGALGINFYIDDKAETIVEASKLVDVTDPNKFQLFVKDAPYNRVQYPSGKVTVVGSVKDALEKAGLWT